MLVIMRQALRFRDRIADPEKTAVHFTCQCGCQGIIQVVEASYQRVKLGFEFPKGATQIIPAEKLPQAKT